MTEAAYCRALANAYARDAEQVVNKDYRDSYLELAHSFRRLAETIESRLATDLDDVD